MDRLPVETLREHLRYDPDTGKIHALRRRNRGIERPDLEVGTRNSPGRARVRVTLLGRRMWAHHIAWALYYGEWPDKYVDHVNGDEGDNRIGNLRLATHSQNCINRRIPRNTSGYRGVSWDASKRKWKAAITYDGKQRVIGLFDSAQAAAGAYNAKAREVHGEFATTKV